MKINKNYYQFFIKLNGSVTLVLKIDFFFCQTFLFCVYSTMNNIFAIINTFNKENETKHINSIGVKCEYKCCQSILDIFDINICNGCGNFLCDRCIKNDCSFCLNCTKMNSIYCKSVCGYCDINNIFDMCSECGIKMCVGDQIPFIVIKRKYCENCE